MLKPENVDLEEIIQQNETSPTHTNEEEEEEEEVDQSEHRMPLIQIDHRNVKDDEEEEEEIIDIETNPENKKKEEETNSGDKLQRSIQDFYQQQLDKVKKPASKNKKKMQSMMIAPEGDDEDDDLLDSNRFEPVQTFDAWNEFEDDDSEDEKNDELDNFGYNQQPMLGDFDYDYSNPRNINVSSNSDSDSDDCPDSYEDGSLVFVKNAWLWARHGFLTFSEKQIKFEIETSDTIKEMIIKLVKVAKKVLKDGDEYMEPIRLFMDDYVIPWSVKCEELESMFIDEKELKIVINKSEYSIKFTDSES